MSGIIDKAKHALHLDHKEGSTTHSHSTTTGHTTGTTGTTGIGGTNASTGIGGTTGSTGIGGTTHSGTAEGVHGQHNSRLANAADPRIDSDHDGSTNFGAAKHNTAHNGGLGSTTGGTHIGNSSGNHGTTGGISRSTNAGPHDSNLGNVVDPRVDSDLSNSGNRHGANHGGILGAQGSHATPGSGTAQNTAGPHNSDLLNKADPRVDADLDGSKTFGGNATHR